MNSASETVTRSSNWRPWWLEEPNLTPGSQGLAVAIAWVSFVGLMHMVAMHAIGPEPLPFGAARFAWTVLVNAALLGLVVGGRAALKVGVVEDLRALRPILSAADKAPDALVDDIANVSRPVHRIASILGLLGGFCVATLDPTLSGIYAYLSPLDPRYIAFVMQNILFGVVLSRLFATELHMTRAYARLGERVEVDLLDPSTVLVFGRKGLRSVTLWVSISTLFSMFWLLDSAGQANVALAVAVLGLATAALVTPTSGVRRNIATAKAAELAIVVEAIRTERKGALSTRPDRVSSDGARLGNLIQYHAFLKSIREWPFDLSIMSRSSLFMLLGAGSWLGGAVVERLLDLLLD